MQANNDQNWADDGAFWDEAWTDMNRRLDENPPRRKRRAAWWWYTGGVLALLLAITPLVVAGVFNGDGSPEAKPAQLKAPSPPPAAAPEKEVYADKVESDEASETPDVEETETPFAAYSPSNGPSPRPEKPSKYRNTKTDETLATSPVSQKPEALTSTVVLPATPPVSAPIKEVTTRDVPYATPALAGAELSFFPVPNLEELPTVTPPNGLPNALSFEAGALGTSELTGFYAGAGYRFKLSERWSVPVSVRYRKEQIPVGAFPRSGRNLDASPGAVLTDRGDSIFINSDLGSIVVDLSSGVLQTEALETRVGLQYNLTPRLRLGTGISAAYLWRADLSFRARTVRDNVSLENSLDLLQSGESSFSFSSNNDPLGAFDLAEGQLPSINPLHLRTYFDLAYDLTPRLSLTAGGSILLRQPDKNETIGVPAGRASLGISWRLR